MAESLQIDPSHLIHLEAGFEGWQETYDKNIHINPTNRYYKVGQNVARLAGLPDISIK